MSHLMVYYLRLVTLALAFLVWQAVQIAGGRSDDGCRGRVSPRKADGCAWRYA